MAVLVLPVVFRPSAEVPIAVLEIAFPWIAVSAESPIATLPPTLLALAPVIGLAETPCMARLPIAVFLVAVVAHCSASVPMAVFGLVELTVELVSALVPMATL